VRPACAGGNFGECSIAEGRQELQALGVARPFVWSRAYFSCSKPKHARR
jgi:hypothetical protein